MRKKNLNRGAEEKGVDISPLIDMVFILLIFFIVTTVFIDERGFEMPGSNNAQDENDSDVEPVVFRVTRDGDVVLDGNIVGLGAVRRTILNASQRETVPVIVEVEEGSRSGLALRVYDEALMSGAESPSFKIAD
ncbi:MAG: biopolymer transporter ExbD [Opitutales bacterium]|nr:biopolymer transporter ExbD [Opitutales bacterium]NRA27806.1 biopolymer transporter ExbD [Opitutales bacterium]